MATEALQHDAGAPARAAALYHIENPEVDDKAGRFLEAFAAVLQYTDYKALLDSYCASSAKCSRCVVTCPVYQVSRDPRDIPCYRTNLLLDVYKRHFTIGGWLKSHVGRRLDLTDETIDEMADVFYRCTACRRCTLECPLGIDHGLITRLGRYILSMAGIAPKALQVSVREQLEGETHNTSKIPKPALVDTLEFLAEEMEESLGVKLEFPRRPAGPGVRLLLRGERLPDGARHPDGQRRRALRRRRLGPLDHRHRQLRRHQLRPLLQRLAPRADHQAARGRGRRGCGRRRS